MGTSEDYTSNVLRMSAGFFFVFMAFNTAANLVGTVVTDKRLVAASNALLYSFFTLTSIVAPRVVRFLGPKLAMVLGAVPYVLLVLANISPSYGLFVPSFIGVGIGAGLLWTGQGIYLSRCAALEGIAKPWQSLEHITSRYNGYFWTLLQFNGAVGLIIASSIFVLSADYKQALRWMYIGFASICGVGVLILATVRVVKITAEDRRKLAELTGQQPPQQQQQVEEQQQLLPTAAASSPAAEDAPASSFLDTLTLIRRDRAMQLLIPIFFYTGASLGFNSTMYPLSWVDRDNGTLGLLPEKYVGFVLASFYLCNSGCSFLWGKIVPVIGRRLLFLITALTQTAYYLAVLGLENKWLQTRSLYHESAAAFALIFGVTLLFAIGDSVLESQVPAIIQSPTFYREERDRDAAISSLRLWMSLGYAVQFIVGTISPGQVQLQAGLLFPLLFIGLVSLALCDRTCRAIDTSGQENKAQEQLSAPLLQQAKETAPV